MKVGELVRLLEEDGWRLARTRQPPPIQEPEQAGYRYSSGGKPSLDVPPGTLNSILKQAGLKRAGSGE